jgi:phosphate transport system protein
VNIARRAQYLATYSNLDLPPDLEVMLHKAQTMVRESLDALVHEDSELARRVCHADDDVDQLNRQMHVLIQDQIRANPERVEQLIHMLSVSRQLERIGDLATNVAEDVVYTVDGEIIRHRGESYT